MKVNSPANTTPLDFMKELMKTMIIGRMASAVMIYTYAWAKTFLAPFAFFGSSGCSADISIILRLLIQRCVKKMIAVIRMTTTLMVAARVHR